MKCPHCEQELKYPTYAWHNCTAYHTSHTVATDCCGKAILVSPIVDVRITATESDTPTDDWGVEYKDWVDPKTRLET